MLLCMLLTPNSVSTKKETGNVYHTQAISEELDNYAISSPDENM